MSTKLAKVVADFTTSLASSVSIGATTATLVSAIDDDSVALPSGRYLFTIDGDNSQKEHISCTLSGTSLTAIKTVTRQGVETSGFARAHRAGASAKGTDFAHVKFITDLLTGTTDLDSTTPLKYDGTASISTSAHLATKKYVDDTAVAGAPDASTTVKGIVEVQTQAEFEAGTTSGGTTAPLVHPANVGARYFAGYAADAGSNDTYAITLSPAPSAYFTGMVIAFKANTANTGACTLNANTLGAKSLKVYGLDPRDNHIKSGSIVICEYDGTNMQILSVSAQPQVSQDGAEIYAADAGANDTYAITLTPAPTAYTTGMVVRFKANTANTGAATLNVNSLGAKSILRTDGSALADGDIAANQIVEVIYDGTNLLMLSPTANAPKYKVGFDNSRSMSDASSTLSIAHGLGRTPRRVTIAAGFDTNVSGANVTIQSVGFYDGTNTASNPGGSTSIISLQSNAATPHTQSATITVDATNINLAFTRGGSNGTETINIAWTAEA